MKFDGAQRVVLVGGGTGGHFYPLIAIAERLNESAKASGRSLSLYYLGPEPYNDAELKKNSISFVKVPAGKRRKYFSPLNFLDPFKTLFGLFAAIVILYRLYPDVIMSKGGYTSVPVVIAGWLLRIPIMIHESDSKAGSANKLCARFARYIAIAFPDAAKYFKTEKVALVGIPIRRAFMSVHPDPFLALNIPPDKPLIFIIGGSLGSQRINNLILESLDELLPQYSILHQTGPANEERVKSAAIELIHDRELLRSYYAKGTLTGEEMHLGFNAASIIISRAGSGSIFEIAHNGKPSILIPIPEEISHDQRTNAYSYARSGAASVLEESNLTDGLLTAEITRIMTDTARYQKMSEAARAFAKHDAAEVIARTLLEIADEHV